MLYSNEEEKSKTRQLTINEIKNQKDFENLSDEQVDELRKMLYLLSEITYRIYCDGNKS
jgi:hypothetical protein